MRKASLICAALLATGVWTFAGVPAAKQDTATTRPAGIQNVLFAGLSEHRSVVFVLDASGSMINKMAELKDELNKAIDALPADTSFNVIFMQDKACDALSKGRMLAPTRENKAKSKTFLEGVTTTGTTDPIPALELAFAQKPAAIYLLTDGDFPDNDAVFKKVHELNQGKNVKVNTIAYTHEADTDTAYLDLLKNVASENGGQMRHVTVKDIEAANQAKQ